jgi:hypothetical protein
MRLKTYKNGQSSKIAARTSFLGSVPQMAVLSSGSSSRGE